MEAMPRREAVKYLLVGPDGGLHETRIVVPDASTLQAGDEVEAEDATFGFKLFFVVRCIEKPKPEDPRYDEAETWVYLELAR